MSFQHTNSTCNPYKYQWQAILPIQFSGNSFLQVKMPNMPTNLPTYIYSERIKISHCDNSSRPHVQLGYIMNPRPTNNFWISGLSRSNLSPSSCLQTFQLEFCAEVRFSSIKTIDYRKKTFHRVSSCYAISRFDLGRT